MTKNYKLLFIRQIDSLFERKRKKAGILPAGRFLSALEEPRTHAHSILDKIVEYTFQESFDTGFENGYKKGYAEGRIEGIVWACKEMGCTLEKACEILTKKISLSAEKATTVATDLWRKH